MTSLARKIGQAIISNSVQNGREMTKNESMTLIAAMHIHEGLDQLDEAAKNESAIYKILDHRIASTFEGDISPLAKLFAAELSSGIPGRAILYAAVLCELSDGGKKRVELDDMVNAFPFNVPSDAVLESAWDMQKAITHNGAYHDNALDAMWAWKE